jgi:hypothetical protein
MAFCEQYLAEVSKTMAAVLSPSRNRGGDSLGNEAELLTGLRKLLFTNKSTIGKLFGRGELEASQQRVKEQASSKAIEHVVIRDKFPSYMQKAATLFKAHSYLRKGLFTNLLTSLSYAGQRQVDQNRLADLCACIELMSTGFYLMENLEKKDQLLAGIPMSSFIADKFSKKNLILSSDLLYASA